MLCYHQNTKSGIVTFGPTNVSKAFKTNAKATYALMQALNNDDLFRVINYESVFTL